MARVRVTTHVDQAQLRLFISTEVGAAVQRGAGRVRDRAKANITVAGRVDTGLMRNATVAETAVVSGNQVTARVVNDAPHAAYQHEGTANDGAGFIYPRRAKVLRWQPRGSTFVFRPKVRGVKGVPFLTDALDQVGPTDFV